MRIIHLVDVEVQTWPAGASSLCGLSFREYIQEHNRGWWRARDFLDPHLLPIPGSGSQKVCDTCALLALCLGAEGETK